MHVFNQQYGPAQASFANIVALFSDANPELPADSSLTPSTMALHLQRAGLNVIKTRDTMVNSICLVKYRYFPDALKSLPVLASSMNFQLIWMVIIEVDDKNVAVMDPLSPTGEPVTLTREAWEFCFTPYTRGRIAFHVKDDVLKKPDWQKAVEDAQTKEKRDVERKRVRRVGTNGERRDDDATPTESGSGGEVHHTDG